MKDEYGISIELSAELSRLEQAMQSAGRIVENNGEKMDRATKRAAQSFNRLEATLDPVAKAAQRLERDSQKVQNALQKGVVTQDRATESLRRLNDQYDRAVQKTNALGTSVRRANDNFRPHGSIIQQAGYQVGDFAVQVASGQNWMMAFTQQGTQLVSMFGPWGAAIGAAGAVLGALATAFMNLGDATEEATQQQLTFSELLRASEELTGRAASAARELAAARSNESLAAAQNKLDEAIAERERLEIAIGDLNQLQQQIDGGATGAAQRRLGRSQIAAGGNLEELKDQLSEINMEVAEAEVRVGQAENQFRQLADSLVDEDSENRGQRLLARIEQEYVRAAEGRIDLIEHEAEARAAALEETNLSEVQKLQARATIEMTARARIQAIRESDAAKVQAENDRQLAATETFLAQINKAYMSANDNQIGLINLQRDTNLERLEQLTLSEQDAADARIKINEIASAEIEALRKESLEKDLKETEQFTKNLTQSMSSSWGTFISTTTSDIGEISDAFGDMTNSILSDMARIISQRFITDPFSNALGDFVGGFDFSGLFANDFNSVPLVPSAKGNVFNHQGHVTAFAKGGAFTNSIVDTPTLFPFAKGTGLMGEAGPEAIMPLSRDATGRLGVRADNSGTVINLNVINENGGEVETRQNGPNIDVIIRRSVLNDLSSGGPISRGISKRFEVRPGLRRGG